MSEVLALTQDLMARRSVTPEDAGCQALLASRLAAAGFAIEHLPFGPVSNVWATHGAGGPVLVFLGHTDVVPSGPVEQWSSDPFVPTIRDGVLYGRGAADMKGSVAAFGYVLFRKLVWDLADRVEDAGDALLVHRNGRELRLPLRDVLNVSMSQFTNPPRLSLRLRQAGPLGDEIVFIPARRSLNPFKRNPVAEELIRRVDEARRT